MAGKKAGEDAGDATAKGFRSRFKDFFNTDDIKKSFGDFKTLGVAAIAGGIGVGLSKAVGEASDLAESVNAVNVTFGDSAKAVLAIGENSAKSFGLAKSEFNQLAVQFSAFAKNIASGSGESVDKVLTDLTTRAADFASVMNLDLSEATQVFMSTLAGETEPIRRFGKDVSAAAVEQFALSTGLAKTKDELTENIKVQARYGLLMQQTADTTGDFANTSDELANSQRIAKAELKDAAASLGEDLLPVMGELVTLTSMLIETGQKLKLDKIFAIPNSLILNAERFGRELRKTLSWGDSEFERNWAIIEGFEEAESAAASFDRELLKNARSVADVMAIVTEHTDNVEAASRVAVEWAEAQGLAAGQTLDQKEALDAEAVALEEAAAAQKVFLGQQEAYVDLLEGRAIQAQREQREEVERSKRAHRLLADAINAVRDATFDSLGTMFDYEESVAATWIAADNYRQVLEETPDDLWAVRDAEIEAAKAALTQAENLAEAAGATENSTVKALLMREELTNLQAKFPELAGVIQGYIDKLNAIPGVVETQLLITADGRGYTAQITGASGRIIDAVVGRASGGPVAAGSMYEVLEGGRSELLHEGGRTFLMAAQDGYVEPLGWDGAAAGGLGGGGINVTITGPVYGELLPETIANGLRRYAQSNGAGFLRDLVET